MDIKQCQAFIAAADSGSMSAAAKQLGYTPSGIIRLINALERDLGFPVLSRTAAGVAMTPEGQRMYPMLREIVHLNTQAASTSERIRGLAEGTLTIGALSSLASFWLPTVIREYQERFPDVKLNIVGGSNARQFKLLEEHEVDCCFCHKGDARFDWISLGKQEIVVWLPADSPLAENSEILLAELDGKPFIITNPDDDSIFEDMMYRRGIEPDVRFTTSGFHATYSMIAAGLGVSVCASGIAQRMGKQVVARSLSPARYLEFGMATLPGSNPSPALEEFMRMAARHKGAWPLAL